LRPECKKAAGSSAAAFLLTGGRAKPDRYFTVAPIFLTGSLAGAAD
jgi:hypothetical protein